MRYFFLTFMLIAMTGCAKNVMRQQQLTAQQKQQEIAAKQIENAQNRLLALDADNKNHTMQVAGWQRQISILQQELSVVRRELQDTTQKLAVTQTGKAETDRRIKAMTASLERRGSIKIDPNSSIKRSLPMIKLPRFETKQVDNVIRVTVPADQLFEANVARLRPGAGKMLHELSAELRRLYPNQFIGIEGHTDQRPGLSTYRNPHELSVAWSVAVYDAMIHYGGMPSAQLFIVGYGQNRPKYSNGNTGIEPRNRRVEFVIYPEMFGR